VTEYRDGFLQANGLRLHYVEWGSGSNPPLLLLHGFGNQAHMWDGFAATVSGRYHVYALDLRGHGDSDHAERYGDDENLADVKATVDQLGLTRFSLVGFSMGGGAALSFAAGAPQRIERLVLVDRPPAGGDQAGRARMANVLAQAKTSFASRDEALAYVRLANPKRPEELVQQSLRYAFREQPDGSYRLKYDEKLRQRFLSSSTPTPDLWKLLDAITCPTLVVRGGNSDILTAEVAEQMVRRLPNAKLEVVPDAGHNVAQDNPEQFNRLVDAFLP